MPDPTLPLLRRTPCWPDESLPSLLERLTQLNHYASIRILGWLCRPPREPALHRDRLACPRDGATFLRLAHLTQLPAAELLAASNHRFLPVLTLSGASPPLLPWLAAPAQARVLPTLATTRLRLPAAAQYCPICLQTAAYHRLSWIPTAATLCLAHQCLLVDRCAQCQRPVSIGDIVRRRCPTCQTDLRSACVTPVVEDGWGILTQQLIQSWFAVADAPALPAGSQLSPQSPALLSRLVEYLVRRLLTCQEDWPTLPPPLDGLAEHMAFSGRSPHRLAPASAYYLYRAACTGLLDWPQGLFRFLDAYGTGGAPDGSRMRQAKRLAIIQNDWLQSTWREPEADFCLQAYVDYLLARDLPLSVVTVYKLRNTAWFAAKTGLWSETRTAQALDLPVHELRRFCPKGALGPCRWPRSRTRTPCFVRDQVLVVQQRWRNGWSLGETCRWLGLDAGDVALLVARGLLSPQPGPDAGDLAQALFDRRAVEDFFTGVAARVVVFPGDPRTLVRLSQTAETLDALGIDRIALLQGVAAGILPAYKRKPALYGLRAVCFLDSMVTTLPDLLYASRGWVTAQCFVQEHGLTPQVVHGWVTAGLIQPQAETRRYFDRQHLEELAAAQPAHV